MFYSHNLPSASHRHYYWLPVVIAFFFLSLCHPIFAQQPVIIGFSPASAKTGDTVTIFATNFGTQSSLITVRFGGIQGTIASIDISLNQIKAVVGTGASGNVSITTPGGTATKSGFTFFQAPIITEFTPKFAKQGDTVLINGNFLASPLTSVTFGGVSASSLILVNQATLKAVVGTGASGNVSVTTPGGTATQSGFTFLLTGGADIVEATFPYPSANGEVRTVASDGKGGVYVAGTFTVIGNVPRSGLAHIFANRTLDLAWNPVLKKTGLPADIKAIAVTSRGVHVGGDFTHVNNQPQTGFATLDFVQGNLLPSPEMRHIDGSGNPVPIPGLTFVSCIAVDSSQNVNVAGNFHSTTRRISRTQVMVTNHDNQFFRILTNGLVDTTWGNLTYEQMNEQIPHITGLTPRSIVINSSGTGKQFFGEGVFISYGNTAAFSLSNQPIVKYSIATGQPITSFAPEFPVTEDVQSIALIHIPLPINSAGVPVFETVLIAGGSHFTTIRASAGIIIPSSISLPLNGLISSVTVNDSRGEIFIGGSFRFVNGKAFSPVYEQTFNNSLFSIRSHSLAKIFYSPQTKGGSGVNTFFVNTQSEGGVIDRNWGSPIFSIPPTSDERVLALAACETPFRVFVGGKFQQTATRDVFEFPNGMPTQNLMLIGNTEGIIAKAPIFKDIDVITKRLSNEEQSLITAYPNPATGEITVEAAMENADATEVTLVNALGHSLKSWQADASGGKVSAHLDLSAYPPGVYRLQMISVQGESRTTYIIKQ